MVMIYPNNGGVPKGYMRDRNAIEHLNEFGRDTQDAIANDSWLIGNEIRERADEDLANLGSGSQKDEDRETVEGFATPHEGPLGKKDKADGAPRSRGDAYLDDAEFMRGRYEDLDVDSTLNRTDRGSW